MDAILPLELNTSQDHQTPRELLPAFYEQYNLGADGGQGCSYVRIEITKKLILYIPNFNERKRAVLKHDIHHLVTGYPSTFKGETEISAWEIGSGCRNYWAAWILDLPGMMMGLLFNPIGVFKAFIRGRRTLNLYSEKWTEEQALDMQVFALKKQMLLDIPDSQLKWNPVDLGLLFLVLIVGIVYSILSLLFLPFVLIYTAYIRIRHRNN